MLLVGLRQPQASGSAPHTSRRGAEILLSQMREGRQEGRNMGAS